jgi:protein-tyrosine phosphatase
MQPSVYKIPLDVQGSLWIMPKPSSEWLAEDIAAYHVMGMRKIISLLASDEAQDLGLADEAAFCQARGMAFLQHQIPDRGLATDSKAFAALARETLDELRGGAAIGIHCRAGIGRSGMLACCVLALHGFAADDAIAHVSRTRGVAVPDTDQQAAYIRGIVALSPPAVGTRPDVINAC